MNTHLGVTLFPFQNDQGQVYVLFKLLFSQCFVIGLDI